MLRRALYQLTTRCSLTSPSAPASVAGRFCDAGGAAVQEHSRGGAAGGAGGQWRGLVVSAATHWAFPPLPRDLTPPKHSFNQDDKPPGWGRSGGGASPFTATKDLIKRKNLFKRSAYIMQTLEYEAAAAAAASRPAIPAFRAGDVLDIQFAVPDNKERLTTFRGLVIARYNRGISSSVTLRAVIHDNAVERTFPLYSPHIKSITLVERRHAARAKLFFLRRKPLRDSRIAGGGIVSAGAAGAAAGTKQTGGGGGAAQKEAAKGPAASRTKK